MSKVAGIAAWAAAAVLVFNVSLAQQPCQLDSWAEHYIGGDALEDVAFGGNLFVTVGTSFYASSNSIVWTRQALPTIAQLGSYSLNGVAYGNGRFVAVGSGVTYVSTNGASWQRGGDLPVVGTSGPQRISFGGGMFVTVSYERNGYPMTGQHWLVMTSSDGLGWTRQSGPTNNGESYSLSAASYGNGSYVVGGWFDSPPQPLVMISTNLASWTPVAGVPGSNYIKGLTYGKGSFVAVGSSIMTSPDGMQWTAQLAGPPAGLWAVGFGDECFVAAGTDHSILTSSNGVNWTSHSTAVDGLNGIAYGNGSFVAVGSYFTDLPRSSAVQSGGSAGGPQGYLQGIGFGSWSGFRLRLNAVGGTYRFQLSTSSPPGVWNDFWTSYVGYPTTLQIDDSSASKSGQRFYRVVGP